MSILQRNIPGARVLDLFAGSGALGLEALSRGAAWADLVENDPQTLRVLQKNIDHLAAGGAVTIHRADALRFAEQLAGRSYDIAVADPPYAGGAAAKLATLWLERPFARILSLEHDARERLPGSTDTRRYGSSAVTFYRTEE